MQGTTTSPAAAVLRTSSGPSHPTARHQVQHTCEKGRYWPSCSCATRTVITAAQPCRRALLLRICSGRVHRSCVCMPTAKKKSTRHQHICKRSKSTATQQYAVPGRPQNLIHTGQSRDRADVITRCGLDQQLNFCCSSSPFQQKVGQMAVRKSVRRSRKPQQTHAHQQKHHHRTHRTLSPKPISPRHPSQKPAALSPAAYPATAQTNPSRRPRQTRPPSRAPLSH